LRFNPEQLRQLLLEMRFNSGRKGVNAALDADSFTNIMMLAIRQGRVPLWWKYLTFEKIQLLTSKFYTPTLSSLSNKMDGKTYKEE
jgi:hypothetical protein